MNALLLNQLATPGLGTLMCRRWRVGAGQLALAVLGFVGVTGWMFQYFSQQYQLIMGVAVPSRPSGWLGWTGVALFIASWIWSGVTSYQLVREAKTNQQKILTDPARPPQIPRSNV